MPNDQSACLLAHRNDQVLGPYATFGLQPLGQLRVHGDLLFIRPALLDDLDDHDAVRAHQTKAGVFGNDVAVVVLSDDLVAIARRSGEDVEHDVLDGVSQFAELCRRTTLVDVNSNKRHVSW